MPNRRIGYTHSNSLVLLLSFYSIATWRPCHHRGTWRLRLSNLGQGGCVPTGFVARGHRYKTQWGIDPCCRTLRPKPGGLLILVLPFWRFLNLAMRRTSNIMSFYPRRPNVVATCCRSSSLDVQSWKIEMNLAIGHVPSMPVLKPLPDNGSLSSCAEA